MREGKGRRGDRKRKGWREAGLAGPPVPGTHPSQTVQVAGVKGPQHFSGFSLRLCVSAVSFGVYGG